MKADATYVLTQRDKIAGHARQLALELIVKLPHAKSMLEVGCGAGFFVEACKDYGLRGVGFDINPHLTEFAQSYKMIDVINGPLTEAFPGKFDLVAAIGVLEHVEKPRDLFKLMVSKLDRDGAIYINVPFVEREHWPFLWRANDNPGSTPADVFYDNDVHITHFSREGLERMGRHSVPLLISQYSQATGGRFFGAALSAFEARHGRR
jgi:SAM-dependent methyltransferase